MNSEAFSTDLRVPHCALITDVSNLVKSQDTGRTRPSDVLSGRAVSASRDAEVVLEPTRNLGSICRRACDQYEQSAIAYPASWYRGRCAVRTAIDQVMPEIS